MTLKAEFQTDFAWSERTIPYIKNFISSYIISETGNKPNIVYDYEEDVKRNTDLIVLSVKDATKITRFACRIRRHSYYHNWRYRQEVTLRAARNSGTTTELAKVLSGWGDYMIYGFVNKKEDGLAQAVMIDLEKFREIVKKDPSIVLVNRFIGNYDASTAFLPIRFGKYPELLVHETGFGVEEFCC